MPIDITRLRVRDVRDLGLGTPSRLLSERYGGSEEKALRATGFTTYSDHRETPQYLDSWAARMKREVQEYLSRTGMKVLNLGVANQDKEHGGQNLVGRLCNFSRKKFGKKTPSLAITHLGFRTYKEGVGDDMVEELKNFWPHDQVRMAYEGKIVLPTLGDLYRTNSKLWAKMHGRETERTLNSLYDDFPDLYTYVRTRLSPKGLADAGIVRSQLRRRYIAGQSISDRLLESPDAEERRLGHRVKSLAHSPLFFGHAARTSVQYKGKGRRKKNGPSFAEIVHRLLPNLSVDDINGNLKLRETIGLVGNLYTEWLLRWTMAIDPTGKMYGDGFADIFSVPMKDVYAERAFKGEHKRPDFLVIGQKNLCVEVKTGESSGMVEDLLKKYKPGNGYHWEIDGQRYPIEKQVAVLHMPDPIIQKRRQELEQAGYTIVDSGMFSGYLEKFMLAVGNEPWQSHFEQAAPRIHNLATLFDFYTRMINSSPAIMRWSNEEEVKFVKKTLETLVATELPHSLVLK